MNIFLGGVVQKRSISKAFFSFFATLPITEYFHYCEQFYQTKTVQFYCKIINNFFKYEFCTYEIYKSAGFGGGKQIYWTNKLVNFEELNEFLSKVLLCNLIKRSRGKIKFACYWWETRVNETVLYYKSNKFKKRLWIILMIILQFMSTNTPALKVNVKKSLINRQIF